MYEIITVNNTMGSIRATAVNVGVFV